MPQAEIMQAAGDGHHHVADGGLPVAEFVLHDAAALHAAHRMLDAHFLAGNTAIFGFLLMSKFSATWFLGRLLDRDVRHRETLKPHVLIQDTHSRQDVAFIIDDGFLMPFTGKGCAEIANVTRFINQEDILHGMTFLLAAIIFRLFIVI